jgi:hypothetical protein
MALIDKFEEAFFEETAGFTLMDMENYMKKNSKDIIFLCNRKPSFNEDIEKTLGGLIVEEAMNNYYEKLRRGLTPESLGHPEYFAFTLQKHVFSNDELHQINLQKDSWIEDFIKKYSKKDLLKSERERLLSISE